MDITKAKTKIKKLSSSVANVRKYLQGNPELLDDVEIAEYLLDINPIYYEYISKRLQDNDDLADKVINSSYPPAFQFASVRLLETERTSTLLEKFPFFYKYLPLKLKHNPDYVKIYMQSCLDAFPVGVGITSIPESFFETHLDVVEELLSKHGESLAGMSPKIQDNVDLVKVAIKQNPLAFFSASDRLKDDDALIDFILNEAPSAFEFASERQRHIDNIDKAKKAISRCGALLSKLKESSKDKTYQNDYEMAKLALQNDGSMYSQLGNSSLFDMKELAEIAIKQNLNNIEWVYDFRPEHLRNYDFSMFKTIAEQNIMALIAVCTTMSKDGVVTERPRDWQIELFNRFFQDVKNIPHYQEFIKTAINNTLLTEATRKEFMDPQTKGLKEDSIERFLALASMETLSEVCENNDFKERDLYFVPTLLETYAKRKVTILELDGKKSKTKNKARKLSY